MNTTQQNVILVRLVTALIRPSSEAADRILGAQNERPDALCEEAWREALLALELARRGSSGGRRPSSQNKRGGGRWRR